MERDILIVVALMDICGTWIQAIVTAFGLVAIFLALSAIMMLGLNI